MNSSFLESPASKVVHHNVSVTRQLEKHCPIGFSVQVSDEAFLVPVDRQVVGAFTPLVERRAPSTRLVSSAWSLDLDDVSAEIAKHHGAERSCEDAGEIENSNAFQHFCHYTGRMMLR